MGKTLIHQLHLQGKTNKEISEITHWSEETIYNMLSQTVTNRLPIELISTEDKEKIKDKYLNGISTVIIGKEFGITNHKVSEILESLGIDRDHNSVRTYNLDIKYFDHIDTPNKAYILGFLFADGHNELKKGTISMALKCNDKNILENIRKELKSDRELELIKGHSFKDGDKEYISSDEYRLVLFSKYMCESLICCGMIPNKSNRLKFPMYIPDELISHFVRGYFDGDGSMGFHDLSTWDQKNLSISILSTYEFNNVLKKYLKDKLNIDSYIIEAPNHNNITSVLYINRRESQKKFCEWMYQDAEMYLKRKYDLYIAKFNINNPDLSNEQMG